MGIELGGTIIIGTRMVIHSHNEVVDAIIFKRCGQRDGAPIARAVSGESHVAVMDLRKVGNRDIVRTVRKLALGGMAEVNSQVSGVRVAVEILEANLLDSTGRPYFGTLDDLLCPRIIVISIGRKFIAIG